MWNIICVLYSQACMNTAGCLPSPGRSGKSQGTHFSLEKFEKSQGMQIKNQGIQVEETFGEQKIEEKVSKFR